VAEQTDAQRRAKEQAANLAKKQAEFVLEQAQRHAELKKIHDEAQKKQG
jgi:hypothetical protein